MKQRRVKMLQIKRNGWIYGVVVPHQFSLPNHPYQNTTSPVNKLATSLCIFTALLFSPPAQAWSGAGHQVIAAGAYRQLSPSLQRKVTEILKAHPDYEKWKESFTGDSANLDLPLFIFMRSSTWPDEIRRRGNQYDHPHWHYID